MSRYLFVAMFLCFSFTGLNVAQTPLPAAAPDQTQPNGASTEIPAKTAQPKKVWTNDDLGSAHGNVSVVGAKHDQRNAPVPAKTVDPVTVSRIRQDLQKLQTQLDAVNLKLASFKEFEQGETVTKSDGDISAGYTRTPVNQQMSGLRQKKIKLEAQIDALTDEARKKGIEPGQLR